MTGPNGYLIRILRQRALREKHLHSMNFHSIRLLCCPEDFRIDASDGARAIHFSVNDPSSATPATARVDCDRDSPPPFAAAHG
jgi:hypothetical protein